MPADDVCLRNRSALVLATALLLLCLGMTSCSDGLGTRVELAEAHIDALNDGDVATFLHAFADDTVILELGTQDDPRVVSEVTFLAMALRGTEGFVASCEPWGDSGARCEGPLHERLYEPAGLPTWVTVAYDFDDDGNIRRIGWQVIHELEDYQYEREFAAWIAQEHPARYDALTEFGLLRHSGDAVEELTALVGPFLNASENWPLSEPTSG